MKAELTRCIQLSTQLLQLAGGLPLQPPRPLWPNNAIANVVAAGIPALHDSRVPAQLADKLHDITEKAFAAACQALLSHATVDVRALALRTRQAYIAQYTRKFHLLRERSIAAGKAGKQPYANDILLYAFQQTQTPSKRERAQLASLTGLTLEQVRVWFQNRRQRMKKRAPEVLPRSTLQLDDVLARVAASIKATQDTDEFDDHDSGYYSEPDRDRSTNPIHSHAPIPLTVPSTGPRAYPAPYVHRELSAEFNCPPPVLQRTAALYPPVHPQTTGMSELTRLMSRLTLRHRRETLRSSTGSTNTSVSVAGTSKCASKGKKTGADTCLPASFTEQPTRKKVARKDPETGRKVAGRRGVYSAASPDSTSLSSSPSAALPALHALSPPVDTSIKPRKRLGPLRRKPAGKPLARQTSESSVASTSSSDSSRSTSYSSDFSLASDSSFTSIESAPAAASMECFQPQQQVQFDPLAAFDFTQLFSSQPSDPLPQPVADFELPPDLLAGLQMPMDTAALPPPESSDFLALLNDPTIQDLLQSVQDMDVVAPQQTQESLTFNNMFDVGSVDTSAFLDLSASTLPTFDAMFGLDTSSFQDTLWNSAGFSLPITA